MAGIHVSRIATLVVYLLLLGVLVVAGHYWVADRNVLLRLMYPLEAFFAADHTRCSTGAPEWMNDLIEHAVYDQFSLANQLAYLTPDGKLFHCESGWMGSMWRSPDVTADSRFRYASLSKLLTADAVLTRVGEKRLALGDTLLSHLPPLPPLRDSRVGKITIDQLLRHRGGFDRLKRPDPMTLHNQASWCPADLSQLAAQHLDFDPDRRFAYANLGYCLLGVVLEKMEGKPFRQIMEDDYGLQQRGMVYIDGPYLSDEVRYDFRNSHFYGDSYYRYFDFPALSSSAGLSGNARELALLVGEMIRHRSLNLLSAARTSDCVEGTYEGCYGYAVFDYRASDRSLLLHIQGGLLFGAASKLVVDEKGGITVWLGSGMSRHPREASIAFAKALAQKLSVQYRNSTGSN